MKQDRNQLLDVTKGLAITLVVLGHAVQQYSGLGEREVLDLWIERYLISFHMPLFMLVSGYLFYFSVQRHDELDIIKGRFGMFVWPILTMAVFHHLRGHIVHFDIASFLADIPYNLFNSLWFFWALMIITILVCLVHRFARDHWVGYVVIIAFTLLLPNVYPLRAYVHLLPTFVVAYMVAKYRKVNTQIWGGKTSALMCLFLLFMVVHLLMLQNFDYDDMIYFSRYSLLGSTNLWADVSKDAFRFLIGIVGSLVVLIALHLAIKVGLLRGKFMKYAKSVGSMTFGIYVFQDLLLLVLNPLKKYLNGDYCILNSSVFFMSILILSVVFTRMAQKIKWVSKLFLGK